MSGQSTPATEDTLINPWNLDEITDAMSSNNASDIDSIDSSQNNREHHRQIKVEDSNYIIDQKISEGPFGTIYKGHKM